MTDRLLIEIPEGYSGIDKEKSDFDKGLIVLKKKENSPWKDNHPTVSGYYIDTDNNLKKQASHITWHTCNHNIFATEEQAKAMQAMAELSQIMANDKRFGKPFTDEEWKDPGIKKYVIERYSNDVQLESYYKAWYFLAFRTPEQRDLFYKENEDLIKQYYMLN